MAQNNNLYDREIDNRFVLFPIKHHEVWDMYKKSMSAFWTTEEVDLSKDKINFGKLDNDTKYFVKNVLAFFAASDGIVIENLATNMLERFKEPEIRCFYSFQIMMENIHCVAQNTLIMTDKGYFEIKSLENKNVNVWNGDEWSTVKVVKTGKQKLYRVNLSNGLYLDCTEKHKWCIDDVVLNGEITTDRLCEGLIIRNFTYPIIYNCDGLINKDPKEEALNFINNYMLKDELYDIPLNYSLVYKIIWLSELINKLYFDKERYTLQNDVQSCYNITPHPIIDINILIKNSENARKFILLISTLGESCYSIYIEKNKHNKIVILNETLYNLKRLGLNIGNIEYETKYDKNDIYITNINELYFDDTYCFNEPLKHKGIFNGILTCQSEMYSKLIDTFIDDSKEKDNLFRSIENISTIKDKANWALKWININKNYESIKQLTLSDNMDMKHISSECKKYINNHKYDDQEILAKTLVAFACVEGIFFSGSFCCIYWLKSHNKGLPALEMSNDLISRDEGLHTMFACLLYKKYIVNKLNQDVIYKIVTEAIDIECNFITYILPCKLLGMNSDLMITYIKFVADRLLIELGYKELYNAKNPFDFMDRICLTNKTNFFEHRVSEYSKYVNIDSNNDNDNKSNKNYLMGNLEMTNDF